MEEFQKILHDLRREVDATMAKVVTLKDNPVAMVAQRNLAICFTHLEDAKMRLGKALEDAGSELPAQFADKANTGSTTQAPVNPGNSFGQNSQQLPQQPVQPEVPAQPSNAQAADGTNPPQQ